MVGIPNRKYTPGRFPGLVSEASDDQLLQLLSRPNTWSTAEMKPYTIPSIPRKRGRSCLSSGFLDYLPPEIVEIILLNLDYITLTRLCMTNSRWEMYIKTQPFYSLVVQYCRTALRQMTDLNLHRIHSAKHVYKALTSPKCAAPGCERLGNLLFLPNCRRLCPRCIGRTPISNAIIIAAAEIQYKLSEHDIVSNIPCFRCSDVPEMFVVEAEAIDLATRIHGRRPSHFYPPQRWSEEATVSFPFFNLENKSMEFGRQCRACYEGFHDYKNIVGAIEIYDPDQEWLEKWERNLSELEETGLAVFGTKQLLQHLRSDCPEAQEYWLSSIKAPQRSKLC